MKNICLLQLIISTLTLQVCAYGKLNRVDLEDEQSIPLGKARMTDKVYHTAAY